VYTFLLTIQGVSINAVTQPPFHLENVLLGFLWQGPQYGYQLHQMLSDLSGLGLIWRVKQSHVYALLEKLEKAGFVSSKVGPGRGETLPPRRNYTLTEMGRAAYRSWLESPVARPHQMRQEFLAKLHFALQDSPETTHQLIDRQWQAYKDWLVHLEARRQAAVDSPRFEQMVLRYRIGQVQAILSWLETVKKDLLV